MKILNSGDILETIEMLTAENLDVRTVTMGISLLDCIDPDGKKACEKIYNKITRLAGNLVPVVNKISADYGIPIVNKRISVTPIAMLLGAAPDADPVWFAKTLDAAAKTCVKDYKTAETHGIRFIYRGGMMFIVLPSGRKLTYVKPKMGTNRFGSESVTYEGVGEQKKWLRLESYGPKFVENIVQATARDILAEAMLRLEATGYRIVMHVHDEAVIEAPADTSLEEIAAIMGQTPSWADGLLLRADGYVCDFYKKD